MWESKIWESFPSDLPAPKCTLHTSPPKATPGCSYSGLLSGLALSLTGTRQEQRVL